MPLLPALLFTIVVTQVPFLFSLYYSLTDWNLLTSPQEWTGLSNFTDLFSGQGFIDVLLAPKLLLTVGIVTAVAIAADRRYFHKGLKPTVMLSVLVLSPIVGGIQWPLGWSASGIRAGFIDLFGSQFFGQVAWVSIVMTVAAVLLSILVGTALALLLDRKFFGQGFVRTLLITPFLVMPVVAALLWKQQILHPNFGVLNWLLEFVGIEPVEFLSRYAFWSVIVVLVWQWSPFMMLIVLAGLQGQDRSVLEAARVDGATPRAIFFQITMPHLRPYMELSILLGAIYLIQVFDHVEVMTGGRPGDQNVPHFVYQRSIGLAFEFGEASAYSVIVVIASIVLATVGLRVLSNLLEGEDPA